jgi:hypothetical protein
MQGKRTMESLIKDIKFGVRSLLKRPGLYFIASLLWDWVRRELGHLQRGQRRSLATSAVPEPRSSW